MAGFALVPKSAILGVLLYQCQYFYFSHCYLTSGHILRNLYQNFLLQNFDHGVLKKSGSIAVIFSLLENPLIRLSQRKVTLCHFTIYNSIEFIYFHHLCNKNRITYIMFDNSKIHFLKKRNKLFQVRNVLRFIKNPFKA